MSFVCQLCGHAAKHGQQAHKIVTAIRPQVYENVVRRDDEIEVVESSGHEIVKELMVCEACAIMTPCDRGVK